MTKILLISIFLFTSITLAEPVVYASVNSEKDCRSCHHEKKKERKYDFVKSWIKSSHAAAGVTCVDCHLKKGVEGSDLFKAMVSKTKDGAHTYMVENPASREMKTYFVEICGNCHQDRLKEYKSSVHGKAVLKNGRGVSCIDCHNPHRAPATSHTASKLFRGADLDTCGRCHKEMLKTYMDTFHGKQYTLGNSLVPTCTYCHIGHELPTDNPESAIHVSSVGNLCAGCHGETMANSMGVDQSMIDNLSTESTGKVAHYRNPISIGPLSIASFINSSYLMLLLGVVGFFTLLSTKDYMKKTKESNHHLTEEEQTRTIKRFTVTWRLQHLFWAFSFIVLAVTGLALKYPESSVAQTIVSILGGEAMRSSIHRIAALVFIITALAHAIPYLLRLKSPKNMMLSKKDFLDALLHVSYLFDRTDKMPLMGRYAWYQKVEYWATVIGACIVISTGIVMWGFESIVKDMPLALVHYSQMIHGWEAILAVLVILVHHVYHTILNPLVFPMDFSWITGRSKYVVMEHEHPLELIEMESNKEKKEVADEA